MWRGSKWRVRTTGLDGGKGSESQVENPNSSKVPHEDSKQRGSSQRFKALLLVGSNESCNGSRSVALSELILDVTPKTNHKHVTKTEWWARRQKDKGSKRKRPTTCTFRRQSKPFRKQISAKLSSLFSRSIKGSELKQPRYAEGSSVLLASSKSKTTGCSLHFPLKVFQRMPFRAH